MPLLERYIFRIAFAAFATTLLALTGVIWVSSALKEMDLVSGKGQTILVFLKVTLLTLPSLVMIIAPIALFVAVLYSLNKLNSDSELIIMNAAGMSPLRVLRPLGLLTFVVSLLVAYIALVATPESFRSLRDLLTQVRADVVSKFLQEGSFTSLDKGITFHYREKSTSGAMLGIFIYDSRDPQKPKTYLAERGQIVETQGSTYIVLERGSIHQRGDNVENAIVAYDQYAIDMDQFGQDGGKVIYKPRERSTYELMNPDPKEDYARIFASRFRTELHDRFASALYPVATLMIAFAALGGAKTTRQGRGAAIAGAVVCIVLLRIAGFAASGLAGRQTSMFWIIYVVPLAACGAAGWLAWRQMTLSPTQSKLQGWIADATLPLTNRLKAFVVRSA
jgi:lipopolysaccharide export system permease protein